MFDQTLLESSPDRAPVLQGIHWLISVVLGVVGYFLWSYGVGMGFGASSAAAVAIQSIILGILLFVTALMLCYVYADSRHLRISTIPWFILTLILSVVGFIIYLIYTARRTNNWKRATMPIAYIIEAIVIGCLILYPLIYTNALPKAQLMTFLAAPPPPPPPPPPPAAAPPKIVIHRVSLADLMKAPTVIPKKIERIKDQPEPPQSTGVVGGVPGGVPGGSSGVIGGILGGIGNAPPPPPPPKAKVPARIVVGGQVEAARAIYQPTPVYPPLAKMARVQGQVRLSAVIAKDGTIQDLKVISGHPLLIQSALSAVRQWRYEPYLLDGVPVVVDTEIDVNFTLSE